MKKVFAGPTGPSMLATCASALFAVLLASPPAFADEAADTATARALGIEGVTLADAGRCKDAIEKLDRAERLHHAPTTATRLAECEIETGKLVLGTERLQRIIREPLAPNAHPAFVAAVGRAQTLLDATLPRLATLRLSVSGPPAGKLSILIDGEPTSEATLDTNRRIDPGAHEIQVRAPGWLASNVSTSLVEGETRNVVVELKPDPKGVSSDEATSANGQKADTAPGSKVPAFVAFGVAAVGLGFGIYGLTAVDDRQSQLSNRCSSNNVCPNELRPVLSEAKTWATVSTAGFITAGVGASVGALLLVLRGSSEAKAPAKTGTRASQRASVSPVVGIGSLGIDGVF